MIPENDSACVVTKNKKIIMLGVCWTGSSRLVVYNYFCWGENKKFKISRYHSMNFPQCILYEFYNNF